MKNKNNLLFYTLAILVMFLILTNSCKKDEQIPVLSTKDVSNISQTTASCGGIITSDGGASISAKGVCWSTNPTPTISDPKTNDGTGVDSFISAITGLYPNTQYYIRAYATNIAGTGYGSTLSFTTIDSIVKDIDGNIYHTVTIGTQVWMVENLRVTHYRNGDPIPNITDSTEWRNLTIGAYCNYNNSDSNSKTYGKLYNWYVCDINHIIAPAGWHIPTSSDWYTLVFYLGVESVAGGKLKETGFKHWTDPNTGATNETGFTGLPAGLRNDGKYTGMGYYGLWWTSTAGPDPKLPYCFELYYNFSFTSVGNNEVTDGCSVRCVKDK